MEEKRALRLVCPDDRIPLETTDECLRCAQCGGRFPVEDGIASFPVEPARIQAGPGELQTRLEMKARDEQAPAYDRLRGLWLLSQWELRAATRALAVREGEAVLDAGCGTGRLMSIFARLQGLELAGADISLESLKLCREKLDGIGRKATLVQAPLRRLPFEDDTFHAVSCLEVAEHIPGAELRAKVYEELERVMRPGARLFITAYHFWQPAGLIMKREGYHTGGIYFFRFRPHELRRELEPHFEVRKIQPIWGYVIGATCFRR
jgi:SAM-dependent methyltransferase